MCLTTTCDEERELLNETGRFILGRFPSASQYNSHIVDSFGLKFPKSSHETKCSFLTVYFRSHCSLLRAGRRHVVSYHVEPRAALKAAVFCLRNVQRMEVRASFIKVIYHHQLSGVEKVFFLKVHFAIRQSRTSCQLNKNCILKSMKTSF